ncbi:hypothetical protein PAMA_001285 [Pampus argenteus]
MSSTVLCVVIFLACALTFSAAQTSCKGRCGGEYYRGYTCQCDSTCLSYGECCKDYESKCTTKSSCKGRCGEPFKRGRLCNCDPDCFKFNQCCPDYTSHCDAEEPTLNEATEQPFNEGDDADMDTQIFPNDEFSNNGPEDPEAGSIPESSSGYGSTPSDLQDQVTTKPTLHTDTPSDNGPTQADADSYMISGDAPTESTDVSDPEMSTSSSNPATTLHPSSTAVQPVSSQPTSTSAPQTGPNTPEVKLEGQAENIDPTEASSTTTHPPVASVFTEVTQDSSTALEDSPVTTTPASTLLDSTPIPETITSDPQPEAIEDNSDDATTGPSSSLPDLQDPSTSVSPAAETDSLTTHVPALTDAAQADPADDVTPGGTIAADPVKVTPDVTNPQPSAPTSKPQDKPDPNKPLLTKPTSKPETKPLDTSQTLSIDSAKDYQADDNNDTDLCSGRPVSAVTTLKNGTVVVFRGHYFWSLDSNRVPGPARGITQVWGVPSPIDTAFTRCSCQGKTYIFKGAQYWRYENNVLDQGYPKVIQTGFDGLQGHITAALSVPQYRRRRESVYFFKRGGTVQKYSYQFGTSPSCGRKVQHAIYTVRNRYARQAVSLLGPTISIQKSWKGFPSTITAAVSVPSSREPEGYKYYVFSRTKSYNIRMDGERPVVAAPKANTSPQQNDVFKCPKKI